MHINGSKESIAMFYVKNLPGWERALRIAMGLAGLVFAAMNWGSGSLAMTIVAGIGLVGAMLAVTGLFGFCPMCAMVGRKPGKKGH